MAAASKGPCALAQSCGRLREQHREVSTNQLQSDWLMLSQQTSEDKRYWWAVSTRVWTAPAPCDHAASLLTDTHFHVSMTEGKTVLTV